MFSSKNQKAASYCTACPKLCHFACPVAEAEKNESLTPWGKQQTARLLENKSLSFTAENVLPAYKCLSCKGSKTFCEHDIAVTDTLHELREEAVSRHVAPEEVFQFYDQFKMYHNPYGFDLHERLLTTLPKSAFSVKSKTTYFPTCHSLGLNPDGVLSAYSLFQKLGVGPIKTYDAALQCCGFSVWNMGFRDEFKEIAEIQYYSLRHASRIVVGSPECAWAMRELYPRFGFDLKDRVVTLVEFLGEAMKSRPFKTQPNSKMNYFYHDSCYLGRYLKLYDLPREMLEIVTGFPPQEFSYHREESICSGAGGGYALINPKGADLISERNLSEVRERGMDTLITGCAQSCQRFQSVGKKMVVKELVSFIDENLKAIS